MGCLLTVRVIGSFAVCRGDTVLAGVDIGTRKARLLLALLAVELGRWVTMDRIGEALWPNAPARRPAQNVPALVSRLRGRFGADVVEGGRTMYRLGRSIAVDLYDAAGLVVAAENADDPDTRLSAARQALVLLEHGDVLGAEPHANWAQPARGLRVTMLRRARLAAADTALRLGDLGTAQDIAERAVADDAFDEAAYRVLMRAHAASDQPARALIAYERLRGTLGDELGTDPAHATRDLHVAILRGHG